MMINSYVFFCREWLNQGDEEDAELMEHRCRERIEILCNNRTNTPSPRACCRKYSFPIPYHLTKPPTSDSSLHPPGTNPIANSIPFYAPASGYQNWLAQQPEPVGYDLGHVVGSSYESSAPSAWNATWPPQIYGNETTTMLPNQPEFIQALRCEVCKIDVNSKDSYEKHIAGKKHQKNLQNGACCIQVQALIGPVVNQSKAEKQVEQSKVCTTYNVLCTGHDTYIKHIAGKKHAAQRIGVPPFQKAAKKIKVAQSAWCETCKINCNSRDMYITHLAGKKHLKNLEKLSNPKIDVGTSSTANASNTLIGPQEKPGTDNPKAKKASISLHLTSLAQIRHQL
ncbi:hypothetical protein RYX36_022542 [Vicia faba]